MPQAVVTDGTQLFIHRIEIVSPDKILHKGDTVTLDVFRTDKGAAAVNVRRIEATHK
nr:hypothetical protein 4 [Desulfobacterales bacterium]